MTPRLPLPDVTRTDEALRSERFGDIYFQEADGLAETRHVFLDGNDLARRFAAITPRRPFVIGELGFGTGLNILAAAELFERVAPKEARLHLWSVEGYPFSRADLAEILNAHARRWPELHDLAERLTVAYPHPRPGFAQIEISERITLTLAFGTVEDMLARHAFRADAWFLDGFSPATNPEMWSEDILSNVAVHTRPGGSFATFTVAGHVRRALTEAGFNLEKRPGFGRKREMLTGTRTGTEDCVSPIQSVAVIGAGIAGAWAAFRAREAGFEVTLFDPNGPASGASGNPAGLVMPRLEAADNAPARFYREAWLYALRAYARHAPEALHPCPGEIRGEAARFRKVLETGLWHPEDLSLEEECVLAGRAALLSPKQAIETLTAGVDIRVQSISRLERQAAGVRLHLEEGHFDVDAVIVAAGPMSAPLLELTRDMSASRGQVDVFDGPLPTHILTDGSYVAPFEGRLIAGATYDKADFDERVRPDKPSTERNREAAEALLGTPPGLALACRASLRATTRDRHPITGPIFGGEAPETENAPTVFALTGLGSRGLVTAPILAAHLVALLTDSISPLETGGATLVDSARFAERRRRRGQT